MSNQSVVIAEYPTAGAHRIGHARLNAPQSLNALGLPMIDALHRQIEAWREDPGIVCVLLDGAGGRAFCAGGDVVAVYHAIQAARGAPPHEADRFFAAEYRLDYALHTFPKPLLVWGDGIVMGGGIGLMVGGSHRVVTEHSALAMPEITLGLYPDVAGSWFLNRMPGRSGLFAALTGARLNAADAIHGGLADYFLKAERHEPTLEALAAAEWQGDPDADRGRLSALLRGLADEDEPLYPASRLQTHRRLIARVTDHPTVAMMRDALRAHKGEDQWIDGAVAALERGSPTSARLIMAQYHRARHLSLRECFAAELELSAQCCRHHDFPEGVRALLIDKDRAPQWSPRTLAEVNDALVAEHFAPVVADNPFTSD